MASHGESIRGTWDLTPPEIVRDGLRRIRAVSSGHRLALIIAAVLAAIGLVALIVGPLLSGYDNRQNWTYVAIAFGYLMSTVAAAPTLSAALRLARGHWRRPVNRIAELWAAALIVPAILFFFLLANLPGTEGRPTVWFGWWGSPWLWDSILVLALVITGYAFLYVSSLPDFAVARDQVERGTAGRFTRLARDWFGTEQQWRVVERAVGLLGAFYIILFVGTMTVIAADFIMSLVPGYKSAIFPAYFVVSSFEGGIALTIVTAAALRRWGHGIYLEQEQFFALGKLQLALGLLWFYFIWTDFIIPWYGRMPQEINLLKFLYFDTYIWAFIPAFVLNFMGPLLILMWTRVRKSIVGPTIAASGVLIGLLADRIRLFSASFSPTDITQHALAEVPPVYTPGVLDILILVGGIAGALAIILFTLRLVPYPSVWEVTAGLRLRARKRYHHTEVVIIGKPE